MKIVKISQLEGTERAVKFTGGTSYRAVLKSDNIGFAMMKTVIPKGGPHHWHYVNHYEACYCIHGNGVLTNLTTGEKHNIEPHTVYVLDQHDNHTFEALTDVVLISVFNPPLSGKESHNENGVYSADVFDVREKAKQIVKICDSQKNIYDAVEKVSDYLTINQ